jgi:hypothetical protein
MTKKKINRSGVPLPEPIISKEDAYLHLEHVRMKLYAQDASYYRALAKRLYRALEEVLAAAPVLAQWQVIYNTQTPRWVPPFSAFDFRISDRDMGNSIIIAKYGAVLAALDEAKKIFNEGVKDDERFAKIKEDYIQKRRKHYRGNDFHVHDDVGAGIRDKPGKGGK